MVNNQFGRVFLKLQFEPAKNRLYLRCSNDTQINAELGFKTSLHCESLQVCVVGLSLPHDWVLQCAVMALTRFNRLTRCNLVKPESIILGVPTGSTTDGIPLFYTSFSLKRVVSVSFAFLHWNSA